MRQSIAAVQGLQDKPTSYRMKDLLQSRSSLNQLIYWMEHDRSLQADSGKIKALRGLLTDIEHQIGNRWAVSLNKTTAQQKRS